MDATGTTKSGSEIQNLVVVNNLTIDARWKEERSYEKKNVPNENLATLCPHHGGTSAPLQRPAPAGPSGTRSLPYSVARSYFH